MKQHASPRSHAAAFQDAESFMITSPPPRTSISPSEMPIDSERFLLQNLRSDLAALHAALEKIHDQLAPPLPSSSSAISSPPTDATQYVNVKIEGSDWDGADETGCVVRGYFADVVSDVERVAAKFQARYESYCQILDFTGQHRTDLNQTLVGGYFGSLPDELFLHTLSFLSARDLCACSCVSKKWRHLCDDPALWRSLFQGVWRRDFARVLSTHKTAARQQPEALAPGSARRSPRSFQPSSAATSPFSSPSAASRRTNEADWKGVYLQRLKVETYWRKGKVKSVQTLSGHTAWISCLQFDDERIVSGAGDKTIRVWRADDGKLEQVLTAPRGALCLQFDKQKIISGYMDNSILVWDVKTGKKLDTLNGHRGRVWAIQYDSQKMISGGADRSLKWWDMSTFQVVNAMPNAHTDGISCLRFNNSHIVSGAADNLVKIWDTSTLRCVQTLQGEHDKAVFCVDVEGFTVVSGSHDSTLKLWDLRMGRCLQTFAGHQSGVFGVQFDDSKLVSCAGDHTIKVWDIKTGTCLVSLQEHKDAIRAIQYDDSKIVR